MTAENDTLSWVSKMLSNVVQTIVLPPHDFGHRGDDCFCVSEDDLFGVPKLDRNCGPIPFSVIHFGASMLDPDEPRNRCLLLSPQMRSQYCDDC